MQFRTYTSQGIILSKKNLGEADKIVVVFSKDFGKLSLVAKGIRRPKSRKRGHLEIFNLIKFQGVKGASMDIMTEAEVVEDFVGIRKSLNKITLAYYFCEVVNKISNDSEANSEVFDLFLKSLQKIQKTNLLKNLRFDFIHNILVMTGYHPDGESMVNHDQVLDDVLERKINSLRVGKRMLS
jgi:DNA repair protein RecO (recombination protein O)